MNFDVGRVVDATGGELLRGARDTVITGFANDSRTAQPGDLFVAIDAERDGHDFIDDAIRRGCVAAIVSRLVPIVPNLRDDIALVQVRDPTAAIGAFAKSA